MPDIENIDNRLTKAFDQVSRHHIFITERIAEGAQNVLGRITERTARLLDTSPITGTTSFAKHYFLIVYQRFTYPGIFTISV